MDIRKEVSDWNREQSERRRHRDELEQSERHHQDAVAIARRSTWASWTGALVSAISAAVAVVSAIYSVRHDSTHSAPPQPPPRAAAAAEPAAATVAQRDTSTVEKALLGHWVAEGRGPNYYIGSGTFIMIDQDGRKMESTYTVPESNEGQNWLKVAITTKYGKGHTKRLMYSADRSHLTEKMEDFDSLPENTWTYLDAKTEP